jgi:hypothetical protein
MSLASGRALLEGKGIGWGELERPLLKGKKYFLKKKYWSIDIFLRKNIFFKQQSLH